MTSSRSIIYSVFVCVLLQMSSSEARSAEERLKLIVNSEFDTLNAVMNEYFIDSKAEHDNLVSETEDYIQDFRNRFFKNYNFSSPRVTSCLRQYLQTDGPIEAQECAQDDAYHILRKQVFKNISEENIESKARELCKELDRAKPKRIAECVEEAKNIVVKNSGFDYPKVESMLDEIYGKTRRCLSHMRDDYGEAGDKAEENCPRDLDKQ